MPLTRRPPPQNLAARLVLCLALACGVAAPHDATARPRIKADKRHNESMAIGQRALEFYLRQEYRTAAELYRRAAQVEPDEFAFMIGVGKSERSDGRLREAIAAYEEVVARAPLLHPLRKKAETALLELRAALALTAAAAPAPVAPLALAVPPVAAEAPPPVALPAPATAIAPPPVALLPPVTVPTVAPPDETTGLRAAGWILVATGAAAAATGIWLTVNATADQRQLDSLHLPDGRYDLSRISYLEALDRQLSINHRLTGASVLGIAFLATEITGIWLVVRETRAPTTVTAGPGSVMLTHRF